MIGIRVPNFFHIINEAYTLLEKFKDSAKFILNIFKKSKKNDMSDKKGIAIQIVQRLRKRMVTYSMFQ